MFAIINLGDVVMLQSYDRAWDIKCRDKCEEIKHLRFLFQVRDVA